MFRFNRSIFLTAAALVLGQAGFAHASSLEGIDMCWKPELSMSDLTKDMPDLPEVRVEVAPFHDSRHRPELIGDARLSERVAKKETAAVAEGVEERPADRQDENFLPVTTDDNVASWATEHFAKSLHEAGLKVVDSGGNVRITGDILQLMTVKGPDYNGDVAIKISVESGGDVIWRGTVSGWARSEDGDWDKGKAKRYCSVLSDALLRAVASLVWYPHFRDALMGQPAPGASSLQAPLSQ